MLYLVGYRGSMIRDYVGDGADWGVKVTYADEGEALRGTGGALRLALARGLLPEAFFLLYGDSFLPVDLPLVEASWRASGLPALMTVLRNEERWDKSNAILREGRVELYDKTRPRERLAEMHWIDYGLSVLTAELLGSRIPSGAVADIADLMRDLSLTGELAGLEVSERFYEVGSTQGLRDLEEYLAALVDAAPPLSVAQRVKLAVILRGRAAATGVAYADAYAGKRQQEGSATPGSTISAADARGQGQG